ERPPPPENRRGVLPPSPPQTNRPKNGRERFRPTADLLYTSPPPTDSECETGNPTESSSVPERCRESPASDRWACGCAASFLTTRRCRDAAAARRANERLPARSRDRRTSRRRRRPFRRRLPDRA